MFGPGTRGTRLLLEQPRLMASKFPPSHVFYSLVTLIVERVQPRAS